MKVPFDGKVNIRLIVEKYKHVIFYYVSLSRGAKSYVKPCVLTKSSTIDFPFVREFKDDWSLDDFSHGASWDNLYINYDEAKKISKEANKRLFAFRYEPYLSHECIKEHFEELRDTEEIIDKLLSGFKNYNGIDFCDVSAGGIQIRLHHKEIKGYTHGNQITIKYDFTNIDDVPWLVAKEFVKNDTPALISKEKAFIREGEKYDWN